MSTLSEQQLAALSALWDTLPGATREKLWLAAGETGKLADTFRLLDARAKLKEPKSASGASPLFRIFADVTGGDDRPPRHARFSQSQLKRIHELAGLETIELPSEAGEQARWKACREEAADAVTRLIERAEADKAVRTPLVDACGQDFAALLEDAACLLRHDQALTDSLRPFDETIPELSPDLVTAARDAYEKICSEAPEASLWFLKILTARLEKTTQIFRVVEKIGRRNDDALVSKTDLADIGDLVLANAEFHAGRFARMPETLAEADTAGHALADFVRTSVGMTREFGIRKDGRWGKTLFAIRANASASLEEFFKHVEKTFSRAVPHPGKGHRGMARPEPLPRADRIERAEADLRFLAISGEWASQAAVGGAQKHVADMVRDELDECARALLEILRTAEGNAAELAAEGLELIVRYMRAFKDEENAELIHRRAVAVRANAA
jgi:hypothetical protein